MNTLYTFGCSFTEGFNENHEPYQEYKIFKGGTFPKTWSELLSEKLGLNLFNYGQGSIGNQHIFTNFCKHVNLQTIVSSSNFFPLNRIFE